MRASEVDMERMGSIMRLVAAEAVHATSQGRWYPKPVAERILVVIAEVREQAATEARRELLAKVERLRSLIGPLDPSCAKARAETLDAVAALIEETP